MLSIGGAIGSNQDDLRTCAQRAQAAEAAGLDFISYGDTQVIYRDCYAVLGACALATERVQLGPMVTNPLTRHPVVTANAMATIDEASGGRAFMAIGVGASSTANAAMARAKPKELAAAIQLFRAAFRDAPGQDGTLPHDPDVISIKWAKRKVPVVVHASGPLGFAVAADHGDALLVRLGDADEAELPKILADVRARHADGPRAGLPFQVWVYAPTALGPEAADRTGLLGVISARAMTLKTERCPPEYAAAHAEYTRAYDYKYHASTTEPRNVELLDRLGLTQYMNDRFSLSGDEARLVERLSALERAGADRILLQALGPDGRPILADKLGSLAKRYRKTAQAAIA